MTQTEVMPMYLQRGVKGWTLVIRERMPNFNEFSTFLDTILEMQGLPTYLIIRSEFNSDRIDTLQLHNPQALTQLYYRFEQWLVDDGRKRAEQLLNKNSRTQQRGK